MLSNNLDNNHYEIFTVGGGIAGASVAYHLAKMDTAFLERHKIKSCTIWQVIAAGLMTQLRATHALTELAKYIVELYSTLEEETGQASGFNQNGTLGVLCIPEHC